MWDEHILIYEHALKQSQDSILYFEYRRKVDEWGKRCKKEFRKGAQAIIALTSAQMEIWQLRFSPPPDYSTSRILTIKNFKPD